MEKKHKYEKPLMIVESFIPNEYISACNIKLTNMSDSYKNYKPRIDLDNYGTYDRGEDVQLGGTFPITLSNYEILYRDVYKWTKGNLPDYGISYSTNGFTKVGNKVIVVNKYNPHYYTYYIYDNIQSLHIQKLHS